MILYFANRKMEILGHATTNLPEGFTVLDDLKTEEIDTGVATFTCSIGFGRANRRNIEEMAKAGNFLLRSNGGENEFYTIIDSECDTKKQEIYIYAEDAGLDLINEVVGEFTADEAHSAEWYVNKYIADSGFEIGINEIPSSMVRTLNWEGDATVIERLASIANSFGGFEVSYSFDVHGMEVAHKYVNIYAERGKSTEEQLRLNRDIDRIITKKSIANLATALQVTGGVPEGKDYSITLDGYEYDDGDLYLDGTVLKSRDALKKWGRFFMRGSVHEGHIVKQYTYDTTSQSELCNRAISELKKICDMEVNYEIEINVLPDNIKIGDRINIVDDDGELYLSARILILETSVTEGKQTATLGEYLIRDSGISAKVEELATQFSTMAKSRTLYTWTAYADDINGNGISTNSIGKAYLGTATNQVEKEVDISDPSVFSWVKVKGESGEALTLSITSSNGTIFKGSSIATVLTAHVYRGGKELVADEIANLGTINWYKDGSENPIASGQTLTINAGDVISKATYIAKIEV